MDADNEDVSNHQSRTPKKETPADNSIRSRLIEGPKGMFSSVLEVYNARTGSWDFGGFLLLGTMVLKPINTEDSSK